MSAYGDITCELCGVRHHEQEDHVCEAYQLRDKIEGLEELNTELLEALQECVAALEYCELDHSYRPDVPSTARDAIAKAKGGA